MIEIGRSRDGGYRLALTPALPFSEAQKAINRLRLENDVLYVAHTALAETSTRPRAQSKASAAEPLLHRIIVRYRTPSAIAAAQRGLPLAQDRLDRIGALTGTPAAHERVMSGDAYVVRLFSRCLVQRWKLQSICSSRIRRSNGHNQITSTKSRSPPMTPFTPRSGTTSSRSG